MMLKWLLLICLWQSFAIEKSAAFAPSSSIANCKWHHTRSESEMPQRRGILDNEELANVAIIVQSVGAALQLPIFDVLEVAAFIVDSFAEDEPSLWDQLEGKVKKEIRLALTDFLQADVSAILCNYQAMLSEFSHRGKAIAANPKSDVEDKKAFISDLKIHFDNTKGDAHKFDFNHFKDSITFDWGIFDIYIASITHQKLVLLMLIASCKELPEKEVDPKFHPETWLKTLAYYESEWKTYAESTGPEAAKYLYWGPHSTSCEDTEVTVSKTALEEKFDFYFGCNDFEGRLFILRRKFPPGYFKYMYFQNGDLRDGEATGCKFDSGCHGLIWSEQSTCRKDYGVGSRYYCGSSARHFYLPIAERVWHAFTLQVLTLLDKVPVKGLKIGEKASTASGEKCRSGTICLDPDRGVLGPWCTTTKGVREECYDTSLPETYFPSDCVSPCGKWAGYEKWCVSRYSKDTPYGGTWKYC